MSSTEQPRRRRERWHKALHDKAVNLQVASPDKPTDDQGFLTITLINDKGQHHRFTVTNTLRELLKRNRRYVEFYSTDSQGRKTGVSLEWRTEAEAYRVVTQEHFSKIRKQMQEQAESDPSLTQPAAVWHGDFGAGMVRDYDRDEPHD